MKAKASFSELFARERQTLIQQIQQEQDERLANISERSLLWLALVPVWTQPLAVAVGFPTSENLDIVTTLSQIEANGYCTSGVELSDEDEDDTVETGVRWYSMPAATRTEVLQKVMRDAMRGLPELQKEMKLISVGIRRAEAAGVPLPEGVERWAQLALFADDTPQLVAWFNQRTDHLLALGKPGELLRWVELARSLEELLGIELTIALGRAARRLELYHRMAYDKGRLVKFLRRDEQIEAFRELIEHPENGWALHYIGQGGAGKTMLIRYITAELAPAINASTARIDFDYLNPDYPARAPGLLLAQLAEELRVYDSVGMAARLFASFINSVMNLHERLGATISAQYSLPVIMERIYATLPHFVEALGQLPQPVLIILDTCEELSKIRVDGTVPPSVDATFGILERLHDMFPNLRVVFSGRRPLASAGAGWVAPGSQLPPRPYLRAHEILGFTAAEARRYLGEIEQVPEAVESIIKHSLKEQERGLLSWTTAPSHTPAETARYNPFDLSLYATWLREDPNLTLDAIRMADADRYIDMRIVRRLKHPAVRALLPFITLLGRADFNTLSAVAGLDAAQFNNVFFELSNQEWISRQSPQVLEVDGGLRPRLLAYLKNAQPLELEAARRALVNYLEKHTLGGDRAQLEATQFSTAFHLLKGEPQRALSWWEKVERRFANENTYDWLKTVCESIMGAEDAALGAPTPADIATEPPLVRAAVSISYAAALIHTGPFDRIDEAWAEALHFLSQHPPTDESKRLFQRARAGRITATARYNEDKPSKADTRLWESLGKHKLSEAEINWLWETLGQLKPGELDTQLAGSYIAAAEAVLEYLETRRPANFPATQPLVNFTNILNKSNGCAELARFADTLVGRLFALTGQQKEALNWLSRAVAMSKAAAAWPSARVARAPEFPLTPQLWLDWRAPEQLDARILLEYARHTYPALRAAVVLETFNGNIPAPSTVDSDRLASAILQLRAADGLPLSAESDALARRSRYAVQHVATCHAHRVYPPLFAAVGEALAAEGRVDEALGMLQAQSDADEQIVENFASVQEADRACLRIIRRMRLRDEGHGVSTSLDKSQDWQDLSLIWAIDALCNPKPLRKELDGVILEQLNDMLNRDFRQLLHVRYRTWNALDGQAAAELIAAFVLLPPSGLSRPDASFIELSLLLDHLEMNELGKRHRIIKSFSKHRIGQLKATKLWRSAEPSVEQFIIMLRHAALDASKETILHINKDLIAAIGYRRAARLAQEEGELLALRLPEHGVRLLDQAHRWYVRANDHVGACIAKICAALALARIGNNVALSHALRKVEASYTQGLKKHVVGLPKWSVLAGIANSAGQHRESFEQLAPHGWRPWLLRLVACLAWRNDGYVPGKRTQALVRLLQNTYGVVTEPGQLLLPTELNGWFNVLPHDAAGKPEESRAKLLLKITQVKRTTSWQSLEQMTEVSLALEGIEPQVKGRVFVEGLMPYRAAARGLLTRLGNSDESLVRDLTALAAQPVIKFQVDHPLSWLCWEGLIGLALEDLLKTGDKPRHFQRLLRDSKTRRAVSWMSVQRALTWTNDLYLADLAGIGWSDLTADAAYSYEIRNSEYIRSQLHLRKPPQVLHVIGTPTETSAGVRLDLSSRHWRQDSRGHGPGGVTGSGLRSKSSGGNRSGSYSGTGSGSGGGSGGGYGSGSGSGSGGRGELIKAENLISVLPQMAMCILQATPLAMGSGSERTGSDRQQAAYLRLLGAELFRLGVPIVITIPPLASEVVPAVLKSIVNGLRRFQPSGSLEGDPPLLASLARSKKWDTAGAVLVFLEAIATAQSEIRGFTAMSPEDRIEAAYDICLYGADVKT